MAASAGGERTSEAASYGRRASLLSIGVGLTGLITYLYFAIASHELSREDYGQIAVLWSAVFITVSTLQRPVEQLLSRTVSEHIAHGRPYSHPVRVAALIQLGISVAFVAIALVLRGADPGRPAGRQRDPLLDRRRRGGRLRRELLRPRLPRGQPPAHALRVPDHLRVGLAHRLPARRRARHRQRPGRRRPRHRRRPDAVTDRRAVRLRPARGEPALGASAEGPRPRAARGAPGIARHRRSSRWPRGAASPRRCS